LPKGGRIHRHEWIAGATAAFSCLLLLVLIPMLHIADAAPLIARAGENIWRLAKLQILTCLGLSGLVLILGQIPQVRARLVVKGPFATVLRMLRATLPLLLLIVFHQTIPLWQRVVGLPEADAALIRLDTWLFGGVNPNLWLEHLISRPMTEYMWAAYLSWFIAFQGTIYVLVLFRSEAESNDMVLATVLTLIAGYIGYVIVPAVGPVHAMKFTLDLDGGSVGAVTNRVVDQFGIWRDAFPSIHSAVSMLLMVYAWRYLRRWAVPYTVLGVSILLSTVYLRWHYVTDVVAGITLALLSAWLAPRLLRGRAPAQYVEEPQVAVSME
jgi:membrane-associated phospholipid phosphatase